VELTKRARFWIDQVVSLVGLTLIAISGAPWWAVPIAGVLMFTAYWHGFYLGKSAVLSVISQLQAQSKGNAAAPTQAVVENEGQP
jgi:hypothetical protein